MITTNDEAVAARLRRLRQHGMSVSDLARHSATNVVLETYDEVGYNFRMTDLQAAVGLEQLNRLDSMLERRRYLAKRYTQALYKLDWLLVPAEPAGYRHNFQSYMIRLLPGRAASRDDIMQHMLNQGISTRRGIMATHKEIPYADRDWSSVLPETEKATAETLSSRCIT